MSVILEALTTEISLGQGVALDHRSHRAVEQGDAAGEEFPQEGVG
jgi:hypothetical protein